MAAGPQAALAAREATKTVPIVTIAEVDLVGLGLVASLARPGANITGFSGTLPELAGKRLELLREAIPRVSGVSVIWNPSNPATAPEWQVTQASARTLGMKLESVEVRRAEDFVAALAKMSQRRPAAVVMISDTLTVTYRDILADFAVKNRIPAIMATRAFAEGGGLMSYGPNFSDLFRRAASQIDKILRGAKPADLPVEQPTKFELVDQPQDRQGARPDDPAIVPCASGPGHRVMDCPAPLRSEFARGASNFAVGGLKGGCCVTGDDEARTRGLSRRSSRGNHQYHRRGTRTAHRADLVLYAPGGEVRVVTGRTSRKARLLQPGRADSVSARRRRRAPYKYVSVEGPIVAIEAADLERDRRPLAHRYFGVQAGDRYIERTRAETVENVLIRMRPERWLTVDYGKV